MGKSIGPINSIVLARAGESDKIYKKDQNSVELNGLCELMIKENQFMNFNDRVDYLQELSEKLFGVEYYLNDFVSTGIMYYDLLDMYNIEIFGKTYNCLMLNDEQNITQGLEENIHTDRPETSETDYKKADTTDRKINQTTLIVDKQNQKIEGVISQIGDRSKKTTTITADIDGLNSKVTNIADLTNTVSGIKTITLENCIEGKLLELNIIGNNTVFDYLYPSNDLYPSDTLYPRGDSRIIVTDKDGNKQVYELGIMDVLRQKNNVYDEYILKDGKAKVIRRINKDGSIKDNEEIEDLGEYIIYLKEGVNEIEIQNYSAQIRAKFAIKSDYTDVFATKVEMNSEIKQTADSINLEVRKKVDENEVISKINQSAESVGINANKIELSANDVLNLLAGNEINLGSKKITIKSDNFSVDANGNATMSNVTIKSGKITLKDKGNEGLAQFYIQNDENINAFLSLMSGQIRSIDNYGEVKITPQAIHISGTTPNIGGSIYMNSNGYLSVVQDTYSIFYAEANTGEVFAENLKYKTISQYSLEKLKKNINMYNKEALKIIKNAEIYSYNLKSEKDTDKKHIGFVIGNKYKTPQEVIAQSGDGIDTYSMCSILWKAVQELTEEIEKLKGGQTNG